MTPGRTPLWRRVFRRARPDVPTEVDDELTFHLEMRAARNRTFGLADDEARARAERRFGDVAAVRTRLIAHDKRQFQAARRTEYVTDLVQDLRFGARSLRRSPAFTLAAVATLALGIGANSAVFSVMHAVVLRPLPYTQPDRLVSIGSGSAGEYLALSERLHGFESVAAWVATTHPVGDGRTVDRLDGAAVTVNLLPMLGVAPPHGRGFTDADAQQGAEHVVLVSEPFAQRLGGGQDVLGRLLTIEGIACRVVGVMPPDFHYPQARVDYWQPYRFDPGNVGYTWAVQDKQFIARLGAGVTMEGAARDVAAVWPALRRLNPLWDPGADYGHSTSVHSLQDRVVGAARGYIWMLFGAVVLVLLIASVNVANLLLTRATVRAREFAMRAALGGGRGRLVRQLLTESVLLAALGAAAGAAVGLVALRWLVAALPPGLPRTEGIGFNATVAAYTALVSLVTGVAFGIVPALRATASFGHGIGGMGRGLTPTASHARVASALVGGEVALAVLLVAASALLLRSFSALTSVAPGFDATHVVAARITVPEAQYRDAGRVARLYDAVLEKARALPGVQEVAAVDKLPMAQPVWGVAVRVEGQYEDARHGLPSITHMQSITPDYFATMGIPLQGGRTFDAGDREGAPLVTIVSEGVAKRFWPAGDAIGKRLGYPFPSPWLTIVGIVPDTKQDSLAEAASTSVYIPWRQRSRMSGGEMWLVARATGDAARLGPALRAIVHDEDPTVAVGDVRPMQTVIAESLDTARFITVLVAAFAALALVLGAVGIYGVMSYQVNERTREMGIRLALGATRAQVVRLVVGRAVRIAVAGVLVGMAALLLASRGLARWLYGVDPGDWVSTIGVPVLFVVVAVVASWIPALRGARGDVASVMRAG